MHVHPPLSHDFTYVLSNVLSGLMMSIQTLLWPSVMKILFSSAILWEKKEEKQAGNDGTITVWNIKMTFHPLTKHLASEEFLIFQKRGGL